MDRLRGLAGLTGLAARGGWTPAALTGLVHWRGGSDPATGRLYTDSTGATPVSTFDQTVGLLARAGGTVNAIQTTGANRPVSGRWPRGGRRNLLTWTEDLANAAWTKDNGATPNLAAGVWTVTSSGAGWSHIRQNAEAVGKDIRRRASVEVKPVGAARYMTLVVGMPHDARIGIDCQTLNTLVVPGVADNTYSVVAEALPDGAYRLTVEYDCRTAGGATSPSKFGLMPATALASNASSAGLAFEVRNLYCGLSGGAYQRVTTANDVTETGQPDVGHIVAAGAQTLPVTLPAGAYTRAWVDSTGSVTVEGGLTETTAANTAPTGRSVDCAVVSGSMSEGDEAQLRAWWRAQGLAA